MSTTLSLSPSPVSPAVQEYTDPRSLTNLRKQLKYIVIGGLLGWYFQVYLHLKDALSLGILESWNARLSLLSLVFLSLTVILFTYILTLPSRGHSLNYLEWQRDPLLSSSIPVLTGCIVFGWLSLLFTLSPLGAPRPPPISLASRLAQAAKFAGTRSTSNLNVSIQNLLSQKLGQPCTSCLPASIDKLVDYLHLDSFESLVSLLGVSLSKKDDLAIYFSQLSHRAHHWVSGNVKVIGWTGAFFGSSGCYLFVFGLIGLVGFLIPDPSLKQKQR